MKKPKVKDIISYLERLDPELPVLGWSFDDYSDEFEPNFSELAVEDGQYQSDYENTAQYLVLDWK